MALRVHCLTTTGQWARVHEIHDHTHTYTHTHTQRTTLAVKQPTEVGSPRPSPEYPMGHVHITALPGLDTYGSAHCAGLGDREHVLLLALQSLYDCMYAVHGRMCVCLRCMCVLIVCVVERMRVCTYAMCALCVKGIASQTS